MNRQTLFAVAALFCSLQVTAQDLETEGSLGSIDDNDVNLTLPNPQNVESNMRNVFGVDDRKPVTSNQYPWRTVGKLSSGCTGTLVGRDLVVTAAHCVVTKDSKVRSDLTAFYPNYINGKSSQSVGIKYVWWGTNNPDKFRSSDWGLIRLSQPVGDQYGWMGTTDRPDVSRVTLVGYSADFMSGLTAGAHIGCYIRERNAGLELHDCDDTRGASGGPMFDMFQTKPLVVSINVAEYRNGGETSLKLPQYDKAHANIAIPAKAFLGKLKEALANP